VKILWRRLLVGVSGGLIIGNMWRRGVLSEVKDTCSWFDMLCLAKVRIEGQGGCEVGVEPEKDS
jgi:hypothetical protein